MGQMIESAIAEIANIFNATIEIGESTVFLKDIFKFILFFLAFIYFCRICKDFLRNKILTKFKLNEGNREAISTLFSYGLGVFGCIVALQAIGLKLDSLAVIIGGLGVGIGFGLQNLAKDFVGGLTLLIEQKIKVGDFIELDGLLGYVREVSLRSTVIRTRNGGDVVVPNGNLLEKQVLNWTHDSFVARLAIPIRVSYGSDPVLVTEVLLNSAYMESSVLVDPAPKAMFRKFGEHALEFELWVWVDRIDLDDHIKSSLNFIIEYNCRLAGVTIPLPQQELWLRNPELLNPECSPHLTQTQVANRNGHQQPPQSLSVRGLIQKIPYFEAFSELQLRQLIEVGYRRRLNAWDTLFREDEPGDAFYIVLSGSVEVSIDKLNRKLATLEAGQSFGELALLLGIPRTATVRSREDTMLFAIDRVGFTKLLKDNPDIYQKLVQELEHHKTELAQRQEELRALGLVDRDEDDKNPIAWVQKRLRNIFERSGIKV
jgi:potassium-dependent mechanosensitive channel